MKNRFLTFIIGILVGAILSTTGFLVYSKLINQNPNQIMRQMDGRGQMQKTDGNIGNPPEKPEGDFPQQMQYDFQI